MGRQGDTIAAVATPAGPGAIGILRLSGPRAADIAAACFRPLGRKGLLEHPPRTLVYGSLLDCEGQVIDQVLCTYSRGPSSYTGEDTAELHCHGAPMVLSLGLEHSRQATQAQSAVTEMTNQLLQKNADMLKMGTVEAAREAERSIVDVKTLQHTNEQLISTLDEVMKIQTEGSQKRREAEAELGRIEGELKQKLLELRG